MRLGEFDIDRGLFLAPMEDVTDLPFRVLCKRLGADVVYSEYVKAEELLLGGKRVRRKLGFRDEERPFGVQLYGADPEVLADAARLAASSGPDFIDLNCGCWVKDVASRGAGAGLLRDLPRMERIAAAVVRAVQVPVTLKTRLGWDASNIRILEVARVCEAVGIAALAVHCRTRDQGLTGAVDHSWIPRIRQEVSIPLIVNGGIENAEDAVRVFEATGCDAVMIGRAAIRNPWIFRQTRELLRTGTPLAPPAPEERLATFRQHVELAVECLGEREGVRELRKHYAVLLHGMPHVSPIRDELRRAADPAAILDHLTCFSDLYGPSETSLLPAS